MPSKVCAHRDLHTVDNLQTCLECGETLFLAQPTTLRDFANKSKQSTVFDHDYDALRLQTGNEIRLVVLLPGKFNDPVVITITIADLLQNPQYEAVSYTWSNSDGDDSKTGRVHSPNGILSITENCEAALRQLRLPAAIRLVWIDAICIDQSCVEERNHQVNLMGKIYRCASKVIICIREANKDLSVCMKRLREKRFPSEGAGAQLQSLFRNRYFHRVWGQAHLSFL